MSLVKVLPSQVKLDIQYAFNLVEDTWGTNGLMALVLYGSALDPPFVRIPKKDKFLWMEYDTYEEVRKEPNDVDIAAIYDSSINIDHLKKGDVCRLRKYCSDEYSYWWVDMQKFAELHLMCIGYDTIVQHKNEDSNMMAVLEGRVIWGDLPRPMKRL